MFTAGAGMMVIPGVIGWAMDSISSWYFLSLHLLCVCVMGIIFIALYLYSQKSGNYYL